MAGLSPTHRLEKPPALSGSATLVVSCGVVQAALHAAKAAYTASTLDEKVAIGVFWVSACFREDCGRSG